MNITARISENGQIIIPPEIQHHLGLQAGDEVRFYTNAYGEIVISGADTLIPEIHQKMPSKPLGKDSTFEEIQEYLDC